MEGHDIFSKRVGARLGARSPPAAKALEIRGDVQTQLRRCCKASLVTRQGAEPGKYTATVGTRRGG